MSFTKNIDNPSIKTERKKVFPKETKDFVDNNLTFYMKRAGILIN